MMPKRGNTLVRDHVAKHHGAFRITHVLRYEGDTIAHLYFWRGEYFTLEGFASGEPGLTRRGLPEGERIVRVRDLEHCE